MALLGIGGAVAVGRDEGESGFVAGIDPTFGLDPLSGFFLALLAVTAVPTLLFARDLLGGDPGARVVGALLAPFTLSLAGVLVARDATSFLAFWELMTLVPAAAILVARRDADARAAVLAYVAITHLGGVGVWFALLALADPGAASPALIAVAALVGFGAKAGMVPLHTWLPRAHPVAPVPFSALMSGLMVAVALYGLIRVEFEWLGSPSQWLGYALLTVGLVSALGGVLWAVVAAGAQAAARVQHDRERRADGGVARRFDPGHRSRACAAGVRGGTVSDRRSRGDQGAAVSRRGRDRTRDRDAGARPSRRPAAPDAVDGSGVRDRLRGARRPADHYRLRGGVADAAVADRPGDRRSARPGPGGSRGPGGDRGHGCARAAVLCEGRRAGPAGPTAQ